jgi:hypothetical protein
MAKRGKIITRGANVLNVPIANFGSKDEYICANAQIVQGVTSTPASLEECFARFPGILSIATAVGVTGSASLWSFPGITYGPEGLTYPLDIYLGTGSNECQEIKNNSNLGSDFFGCLWGVPEAPYNCSCPELGSKFEAYLKHRLNVATFWNTPKATPVKRKEFLDALKYAKKLTINIAGDYSIKVGCYVEILANNISGYPYSAGASVLNGIYWVLGVKHVFINSGTHETILTLSDILPVTSAAVNATSGSGTQNTTPPWNSQLDIPNNPGDFNDPFTSNDGQIWS